jgi:predicted dehydrogenase
MAELDVIVVGAGRAGKDFHVDAFNAQPDTRVVAICDPDEDQLRKAATQKKVGATYSSLDQALESHKPDIVSICSPPKYHLEQACRAMEAGAHVLLEKPMVMTAEEADRLKDCWQKAGVKLCIVHNLKFQAGVQQAVAAVSRGEIGKVLHVERTWMRNGNVDRMITDKNCWCYAMPGGRWTETASHDIYIAYQFLGKMKLLDVSARKLNDQWPWLKADELSMTLESQSGYLTIRYSAAVEDNVYKYMVIHGSKGVMVTDGVVLTKYPMPSFTAQAVARFVSIAGTLAGMVRQKISGGEVARLAKGTGHFAVVEQFVRHVREDAAPPVSWDEAYDTMRLVDEIGHAIEAAIGN